MKQVRGWIDASTTIYALQPPYTNTRYVESMPPDAIRFDATILASTTNADYCENLVLGLCETLPDTLVGKRVRVTIVVEA